MKNKGKAIVAVVVMVVVLAVVIGIVAAKNLNYVPFNDFILNPDNGAGKKEENEKKEPTLALTKIRSEKFNVELNGEEKIVEFIYSYSKPSSYNCPEDVMIYSDTYLTIVIDGIHVNEKFLINYNYQENEYNYEPLAKDTIHVVKGSDKDYLVFEINVADPLFSSSNGLYIYDDLARNVDNILFDGNQSVELKKHDRKYKYSKSGYRYIIDEDKIYYLDTALLDEPYREEIVCYSAREIEVTIKDGNLEKKALELYDAEIIGAC